ncbi:MAG: hypothetical protein NC092_09890, partial [Butyrivibrio sp.]|nr:hypothetical protein [Butyrivibrio sp.]
DNSVEKRGDSFDLHVDKRGGDFGAEEEHIFDKSLAQIERDVGQRARGGGDYQTDGALAFFYPEMKERLADLLEGDYYVGFLNVNEVVVCPVRRKILGELKSAVFYANALLDERKKLTDRIYRYSSSYGRLIEV